MSQAAGNGYLALVALRGLALVKAAQGRLREASETYRQAQQLAAEQGDRVLPAAGYAHVGMGELLYEWNDLEGAYPSSWRRGR